MGDLFDTVWKIPYGEIRHMRGNRPRSWPEAASVAGLPIGPDQAPHS